jgi:selenide,water dikinase
MLEQETYKLTQYSHGAGCGCKIAPAVLDEILSKVSKQAHFPALLVGNDTRDDAAVFDLGNGTALVSTTDFFMPIVDDAVQFGRIASVNAISDVYAMGGKPVMAIAILGWPIDKLPAAVAGEVLEGARQACAEAGIPLCGGHSIDSPEPIFGLAVTGLVHLDNLKKNSGATVGSSLYLTKPIGVGILTTAQKRGILQEEHSKLAPESMMRLNQAGEWLGALEYVEAMTDVTGFGLLGHLSEMCEGSGLSARIYFSEVPVIDRAVLDHYLDQGAIPGGTNRNYASYGHKVAPIQERMKHLLCDPQTSGGLLIAVRAGKEQEFEKRAAEKGLHLSRFGSLEQRGNHLITVM